MYLKLQKDIVVKSQTKIKKLEDRVIKGCKKKYQKNTRNFFSGTVIQSAVTIKVHNAHNRTAITIKTKVTSGT